MTIKFTEKDRIFNLSTATWKGKMLKDMTRDELYIAFNEMHKYYDSRVGDLKKDIDTMYNLITL